MKNLSLLLSLFLCGCTNYYTDNILILLENDSPTTQINMFEILDQFSTENELSCENDIQNNKTVLTCSVETDYVIHAVNKSISLTMNDKTWELKSVTGHYGLIPGEVVGPDDSYVLKFCHYIKEYKASCLKKV